jgi:hypothetical protein
MAKGRDGMEKVYPLGPGMLGERIKEEQKK